MTEHGFIVPGSYRNTEITSFHWFSREPKEQHLKASRTITGSEVAYTIEEGQNCGEVIFVNRGTITRRERVSS